MKLLTAIFLALVGSALPAHVNANITPLPDYEARVLPAYVISDRETLFQVANNLDDALDTYHIDFAQRRWTKTGVAGVTTGGWDASQDAIFNPATPKNILCLAGPWAFAGCLVLIPVVWATCEASATTAMLRAQQACQRQGRMLEIRDSGICGQRMRTQCRLPTRAAFATP